MSIADLYDQHEYKVSVGSPLLRDYGGRSSFHGEVFTAPCPGAAGSGPRTGGGRILLSEQPLH